ncbi:MAG: Hpt domain-containing protein [Candidatus Nanopelagicales bacterium]|nr:Hpt domain-containing protein [Candidatus Nanopelagicales bacterium]
MDGVESTDRAPVDFAVLEPLLAIGDGSAVASLIELFRQHGPADVEEIETAASDDDPAAVRMAAHRLRGSAATLGAGRVEAIARRMEEGARSGGLVAARDLDALEAAVAEAIDALTGHFGV